MRVASPAVLAAAFTLFPTVATAQPDPYPGRGILSTVSVGGAVTAAGLQAPGGTGLDVGRIGVEMRLHHDLNAIGYDFGNKSSRSRVLAMLFTVKVD
jgi:hypothetical protein